MREALQRDLEASLEGEVRFDKVSRALYSTDASVYQIEPLGVVVVKSRDDILNTIKCARKHGCSITARGGGTSQAGQAIGEGIQLDTSKHFNRLLEINVEEQWARVEPGIVLDELNAKLAPYRLRFAPDISTASRATIGGMISNNSSGARSVLYGKTIDHVLDLHLALADSTIAHLRPLEGASLTAITDADTLEGACYRIVRSLAEEHATEIDRRYPKILRRVGGYNLDAFTRSIKDRNCNLAKIVVGSEGTLGIILEARLNLVPLPNAKAVLTVEFENLLDALGATPAILTHKPSAVEVMDSSILDHAKENPSLDVLRRTVLSGNPGALLCVEFYADDPAELTDKLTNLERDLAIRMPHAVTTRFTDPANQAKVWQLREASLGLSMAIKGDAKSISFVEDTAVAPEKLRDYIERFLQIVKRHGTTAGIYAHASVGCLHVRPVVNMKTEQGIRQFEAIANDIAELVLEFGGSLSAEHGDGLVRGPFMSKMFGPNLYEAFRSVKSGFDPEGIFNPGKVVNSPALSSNLRYGAGFNTPNPEGFFDYSEYGGLGRAVEMCSGVGACRKTLTGTMCPSYMATRDEAHSTRGRANVLRQAMQGQLNESGLGDEAVYQVLDLCLECRACKTECPVGVDVARFKSEFLADHHQRHGAPLGARALGHINSFSAWASRLAPIVNATLRLGLVRRLNQRLLGIDQRRPLPEWTSRTLSSRWSERDADSSNSGVVLFKDTFTNYFNPEIGLAAADVLDRAGIGVELGPSACCGRPLISQGFLSKARKQAAATVRLLREAATKGKKIVVLEPSCLSALKDDIPALLRGIEQKQARQVADACILFEEFLENKVSAGHTKLPFGLDGPEQIVFHGHCHQKSLGLVSPTLSLLRRIPGASVTDLDAGCCGMAGSFGYGHDHYDISQTIGERRLLPAARGIKSNTVLIASGVSCRQQVHDFTGFRALHTAELLSRIID